MRRTGRTWPLRAYIGTLLLVILLTTVLTTAFGLTRTQDEAVSVAERDARFAASLGATDLAESVAELRSFVEKTAANPGVGAAFAVAECSLSFGTVGVFASTHLDLVRTDGSVRCSSAGPAEAAYRDAAWVPASLGTARLAGPIVDARTGHVSAVSTAPVPGRGAVAAFIDLTDVARQLGERLGGTRRLAFVLSTGDGTVLSGAAVATADAVQADAIIAGTDWHLRASAPRAAVLRTAAEVFAQQAVVTLGGLLVIFLATILVYRGISDPIRRLDRDVTRGMNASVTEPLIEAGPAEIRQLARNFNSLIGKARDELAHRERSDEQARELTARLDRSQRMESLGQLAGGVAHDFNNLLAVILNYTEFVRDALPGDSPVREDLEEVRRAAERAADLTRQLLIFARREVMKLELLDVNAVVAGLEGMLRRTIGEHIELTTALAGPLPAVRADRGQLDQVLMNLALNARDAMPAGGRMVIETADVTLDDECASFEPGVVPGRYVRLTVSDTGEGMSAEVAARALEPFFTTKPAGRGTGLGLATVYGIVTRVGGTVRIYSEVGHGTLVAVQLPVADGVAGPAPAREEEPVAHATGAGRIVLVEDESAVLLAAVRILSATGYSVEGLSDSAAALRALADPTVRIDLLITDVAMPGMSGLELARRAREVRPGLPVLLMTGYSQEVVARQAEAPDGGAVVQKPFTRRSLLQAVREALANAAVP